MRFIEDRLDNMSGGDAHGPDRIFDITMAFDDDGVIKSMKIRALDDVGAYPGRAPLQLGKPMTALCGPYRVNSIEYEAISVTSNKPVRYLCAGSGSRRRTSRSKPGSNALLNILASIALKCVPETLSVKTSSMENPAGISTILAISTPCSKVIKTSNWNDLIARRDALRAEGKLAGVSITTCLEPGGGNNIFEYLFNPKLEITTFVESVLIKVEPTVPLPP